MNAATSASPRPFSPQLGLAAVLVGVGLLLPSSALVQFLRPDAGALLPSLLLGATLFRVGLVGLGVAVLVVGRLVRWTGATEAAAATATSTAERVTLAVILVAALALRLYRLDSGLWYDEIMTYVHYVNMPVGDIVTTFDSQNQHFLFSLLAHASVSLFGVSAWALRLPAALFGVGSIWAVYALGREVGTAREGLLAAGLLTVSYQHIWFSQNARGYSGLLFWTLLSSWLLLRALRVGQPRLWLLYALAAALGVYTHMTMLFVLAGQFGLSMLAYWRRQERQPDLRQAIVLGFVPTGLLTLQLHALVLPQFVGGGFSEDSTVEAWKHPLWTLLELAKGLQVGFAGGLAALAALLVLGVGLASFAREKPLLLGLLFVPAGLCAAVVIALGHHIWPRFFFFALGFAALVVVRGAVRIGELTARFLRRPPRQEAVFGVAVGVMLAVVAAHSIPLVYGPKQDYEGALAFIEANQRPGDAVVTVGLAGDPYQLFYHQSWEAVDSVAHLNQVRASAQRTWLVYTLSVHAQSVYPEVMDRVEQEFKVVRRFDGTAGDGAIYVCLAENPPA